MALKDILKKAGEVVDGIIYEEQPSFKNKQSEVTPSESLLIEENTKEKTIQTIPNMSDAVNTVISSMNIQEIDPRYEKQILDSVRKADQPGPDFLEFSEAVKSLRSSSPTISEDDSIRSTFIVMKSSGVTKERLLETAKHYLDVIKSEKNTFESSILKASKERVEAPQQQIQDMLNENNNLQTQILELQRKVENNNKSISTKRDEITQAQTKLEVNKKRFHNTVTKIENDINGLVSKIESLNF